MTHRDRDSTRRRLGRLEPSALRGVIVREVVNFSSFWRSSTFSSTVDPTIYMLAFGLGLGSFLNVIGGYDYIDFVGTGIVATTVLFAGAFPAMYSTFVKYEFQHTYDAILAAPVDVEELVTGEALWIAARVGVYGCVPMLIAMLFGLEPSWGMLLVPVSPRCRASAGRVRHLHRGQVERDRELLLLAERPADADVPLAGTFFPLTDLPSGRRCSATSTRSTTASSSSATPSSASRAGATSGTSRSWSASGSSPGAWRSGSWNASSSSERRHRACPRPASVQRTYYLLMLGNTLAASFIWGINTIFLLDAGLSNLEAFAANAFFTAGMVIFEVPTGIVADTVGRRASYLLGTITLTVTTLLYVLLWQIEAPFWEWAVVSMLLGLGFTFFSGAVEAWLVDALTATGFDGDLETVFGRGQIVSGAAMLGGSVAGGYIAQVTSLGVPFVLRAVVLAIMFVVAFALMRDIGFTPERGKGVTDRDAPDRLGVHPVRLARPGGQVAHGLVDPARRHRDLRLLRAPALPARARRRPRGVRHRRPGGRDRRRRPDRRRVRGAVDQAHVPPPHDRAADVDRRRRR